MRLEEAPWSHVYLMEKKNLKLDTEVLLFLSPLAAPLRLPLTPSPPSLYTIDNINDVMHRLAEMPGLS